MKITDGLYVELKDDDEYIIVTYKIYGKEIEIIKFERKKKGGIVVNV